MEQVRGWVLSRELAVKHNNFPMAHQRCSDWGRTCDFKAVCTGESLISNNKLYKKREYR